MGRKTDVRRDSRPQSPELFADQQQKAELEARNGLLQFDEVVRLISEVEAGARFRLRPSTIQELQRIAIHDIYVCAGTYRTKSVFIQGTDHAPPAAAEVPRLVEEMCDYVNDSWGDSSPVRLASYLMWRINWIHPFAGGNGRTSRAVSYLVLCSGLGHRLPGTLTIPDQIVEHRQPYYAALDAADLAWGKGQLDVSVMEELMSSLLARQLVDVHAAATKKQPPTEEPT
jgi:Fic family protein